MAEIRYEVVVTSTQSFFMARIEELRCEALGSTPEEASENARKQALKVMDSLAEGNHEPPAPYRHAIFPVELPRPQRTRHLALVSEK
jgi:predicted RNase H-like HicB family nuclease